MLNRRDLLRLSGSAAALAMLPRPALALARAGGRSRLFFDLSEIPRIRANAASSILAPIVDGWAVGGVTAGRDTKPMADALSMLVARHEGEAQF